MTKILAALDAMTKAVFSYKAKDKGLHAMKTKRKLARKARRRLTMIGSHLYNSPKLGVE